MRSMYRQVFVFTIIFSGAMFNGSMFNGAMFNGAMFVSAAAKPAAKISSVTVTSDSNGVEVEIAASEAVAMRSQVATGPDRLVLDFPNALPGSDLHNQAIDRGEVNGIRVGLFSQNPPVTRVVIDLKSAQQYRIYPSGKTVLVKLLNGEEHGTAPAHVAAVSFTRVPVKPAPKMEVDYKNGQLSIWADKASLAEVLNEVHSKTGTDIPIPPGAAQEQMVANIGPAPVREALTALLNGSRFNFIMVGADNDPAKLKSVILTFRGTGVSQPAIATPEPPPVTDSEPQPEPPPQPEMQPEVQPQPEMQPPPQEQQAPPEAQQEAPPPQ